MRGIFSLGTYARGLVPPHHIGVRARMKHENPDIVSQGAQPIRPSRRELLLRVAEYFDSRAAEVFRPVHAIEYCSEQVARSRATLGTAFAAIVVHLNSAGIPTKQELGSVMDNLPMTRDEAHKFACDCNGHKMDGASIATRLRALADS